jgi:hypothetical protein
MALTKSQIPISKSGWILNIGAYLGFGACHLELHIYKKRVLFKHPRPLDTTLYPDYK